MPRVVFANTFVSAMDSLHIKESSSLAALLPPGQVRSTVRQWLADDMPSFDVGGLVVGTRQQTATIWMKQSGVLAGKVFVDAVFAELGCEVTWNDCVALEGSYHNVTDGNVAVAEVKGPVNRLLQGERTALNTLSRCSGVATAAWKAVQVQKKAGWQGQVAGTRKTTPGFRVVEKYGLLVGGAATHRLDLSQMTMLKDNHIWTSGNVTSAVTLARRVAGFSSKIEVECQSLAEAQEAAQAGADIVMLDNFQPLQLRKDAATLKKKFPHVLIEASGGITIDSMADYFSEHVDIISQGSLTQGYDCIDFSLNVHR